MNHEHLIGRGIASHSDVDRAIVPGAKHSDGGKWAWDDLLIPPSAVRLPSSGAPTWVDWGGVFKLLRFDKGANEYIHFTLQFPHGYVQGTDIMYHAHFTSDSAMADGETVGWEVLVTAAPIGGAFPAYSSAQNWYTSSGVTATDTHCVGVGGTLDMSNIDTNSGILVGRMRRIQNSDTFAGDALLMSTDFHIKVDRLGSGQATSD